MKKISILGLLALWLFFATPAWAIVDPRLTPNNRFGIHILEAEDLKPAADLVNSNGGQWGYVTLVIRFNDLNRLKWQEIFDRMRQLKLIPLVRLATVPEGASWTKPKAEDVDRWIEFLNSLNWVAQNRYVILFNEPNHAKEWGNELKPHEYADIVKQFSQKLKAASDDYFILPAGLDTAAPNSKDTMTATEYWRQMYLADNEIFKYFDGWNSHSYPNPNFSGSVSGSGLGTIISYRAELQYLSRYQLPSNLPVFITETGWLNTNVNLAERYREAYSRIWTDSNLMAVTPFVLNYPQTPFLNFSWIGPGGTFQPHYQAVADLPKIAGRPVQINLSELVDANLPDEVVSSSDYHFNLEFLNLGQSIWDRENFSLHINTNLPNNSVFLGYINQTEPGQSVKVGFSLKTPMAIEGGAINLFMQLAYLGVPFGGSLEKTISVIPPPRVEIAAKRLFKAPFDNDQYRLLVYSSDNELLQETSAANFGRFDPIDLYNLVPGQVYRLVLLKPYYLPRQTWVVLSKGDNLAYFKPLLPFDLDLSGHLSIKDFWAWLLLPLNYIRFGLQPGN